MVFQNYALFPHMTVGENLAFPLQVRGLDPERRRDRVRQALQLVRLDGLEHRRPRQLSGGQQQRVAIARALVFEPNLVLMDEPLGALDRRLREDLQYEIRRIHRDLGVTVLYVTHDQQEAMVLSDRVAVFRAGRIEQIASPEALYEEPTRSFVARFIGENNRLTGRVAAVDDEICEVDVGGELVRALRIAPCVAGDATTLSIRPERVALAPTAGLYTNEFEARIEDITFLGDHLRLRVTVASAAGRISSSRSRTSWATARCWRATGSASAGHQPTVACWTRMTRRSRLDRHDARDRGHAHHPRRGGRRSRRWPSRRCSCLRWPPRRWRPAAPARLARR